MDARRITPLSAFVCLALLWMPLAGPLAAQSTSEDFALRDGDRVVFYGDSITDQRRYTSFVESFVMTRFPDLDVSFVHSGWGGDRVTGGGGGPIDVRIWRDILPYNPTVVTIMLGMNDGGYRAFDPERFDTYSNGYEHIVETLRRQLPGVRITAIQPSAYDDVTREPVFSGGYNSVLVRYSEFLEDLAEGSDLGLADLNAPLVSTLETALSIDAENAARLIPDRVHPGTEVALVMAGALLQSWNAPGIVSEVEIDAGRMQVSIENNATVSGLNGGRGIAWTQLDGALPMAVVPDNALMNLVLESSDFIEALNRQPLRVGGLAEGTYVMRIDGEEIGSFTADQLASGVNLAELPTPMVRQAAAVHDLTLEHTAIHNTRWRQLQVPFETNNSPELLAAMASLDELDAALIRRQREAAQPRAHRFEIVPER
jgi:lysophospholipase L1-like esterase